MTETELRETERSDAPRSVLTHLLRGLMPGTLLGLALFLLYLAMAALGW